MSIWLNRDQHDTYRRPEAIFFYNLSMRLIIMILVLFLGAAAVDWTLVKEKDGITVHTRPVEGSDFLEFKGETVVEGRVDTLVAILYDTPSAPQWLHQCDFAMTIGQLAFTDNYTFQTYDLPFPVRDRQVILHALLSYSGKTARLDLQEENAFCHHKTDSRCLKVKAAKKVWISKSRGFYMLEPVDEERCRVTWQQHIEPGGTIPEWLVNALIVDMPYNSLLRLHEQVKNGQYRQIDRAALEQMWQEQLRQTQ